MKSSGEVDQIAPWKGAVASSDLHTSGLCRYGRSRPISNGVLNLVADKPRALAEAHRILRPGGVLQFADIAVGQEVPHDARCDVELWTDCIAGGQSVDDWCTLIVDAGFTDVAVSLATDTFGEAAGEERARAFEVFGHTFRARKPTPS